MNIWLTLSLNPLNQWKFLHKNGAKWNSSPLKEIFWIIVFLFLCLGLLVLTTIKRVPRFFDIKWLSVLPASLVNTWRKFVDIFCSSRCWMYQGFQRWPADLSQYATQKRESKFRGEKRNQSLTLVFNPFLFLYLLPKMRSYMQWSGFITGRFSTHYLFPTQYLSINGFNNFPKICIGILHVSKQCFFQHLWMAF